MKRLVDCVYDLIRSNDTNQADFFIEDYNKWSQTVESNIEQVLLNRYWRVELGLLAVDTISEREALVDNVPAMVWLSNFQVYVLPTIVRHNLPFPLPIK